MTEDKQLFAVIAASKPDMLTPNIESLFRDANLSVGQGQWLLIGPSTMTPQELAEKLGISGEVGTSTAVVFSVNSLFARTEPRTGEWLATKMNLLS
jgi:hypothetical protein